MIFHSEKDYNLNGKRTEINLRQVQNVFFHYDKDAPVKSKKLMKENNDESRFDVLTNNRVFGFKSEQ